LTAILDQRQVRGDVGTRLTAAIGLGALVVVVAISPIQSQGQTVSQDRLVGLWDMQRTAAGDVMVLRLCHAELFSRSELPVEQMNWWPPSSTAIDEQIRFELTRDAGRFAFVGTVANSAAEGSFTFEPSTRFEAELRRRDQPSLTPSQYLALAQHDIGLAVIDEQARQGNPGADLLRMIHAAQIRAHLEDMAARAHAGGAPSPGVC
jgi:hypothetical protein